MHVQVDAPLVFSASSTIPAVQAEQLVHLPLTQVPWLTLDEVAPPTLIQISLQKPENKLPEAPPKEKEKKKGFFGRLFAAIFGT